MLTNFMKFVLPISVIASSVPVFASDSIDVGDIRTQKVMGYDVLCNSYGDLYWQSKKSSHKAYNFCKPGAVNLLLTQAAQLKQPNFAGDLKLFSFYPNINGKPQQDYSLVVVVDEKAKQILPDAAIYMNQKYVDQGVSPADNKKAGYSQPTGKVASSVNSAMYCFKNPNLAFVSMGGFYPAANAPLCSLYMGYMPGTNITGAYGNFMVIPRPEDSNEATHRYSIFTGITPEKTGEYEMYHRTAKQLINKARGR